MAVLPVFVQQTVSFSIRAATADGEVFLDSDPQLRYPWTPQASRQFAVELKRFCASKHIDPVLHHKGVVLEPWFDEFVWRSPFKVDVPPVPAAGAPVAPPRPPVARPKHFVLKIKLLNFPPNNDIELAVGELVPDQVEVSWAPPQQPAPPAAAAPAAPFVVSAWADARAFALRGGLACLPPLQTAAVDAACAAVAAELKAGDTINAIRNQFLMPYTLGATLAHLRFPRGLLLWGPPGTAKSQLAQLLFENSGIRCIWKGSAPELNRSYVGQTEQELRRFALDAASTPQYVCALIIDELDSLCRSRSAGSHGSQQEHKTDVLNAILGLIGGLSDVPNLVLIGCTNFKSVIDAAVLRAGRVDQHYFMGCLKRQLRQDFLAHLLQLTAPKLPLHAASMSALLPRLVSDTAGFTGAQIRSLVSSWVFGVFAQQQPDPTAILGERLRQFLAQAEGLTYQKLAHSLPPLPPNGNALKKLLPSGFKLLAPYIYNSRQNTLRARIVHADKDPVPVKLKLRVTSGVDVLRFISELEPDIEFVRLLDEQLVSDLVIRGSQGISERIKATFDEFEEYAHQQLGGLVAIDIDAVTGCNEDVSYCEQSSGSSAKISTGAGVTLSVPVIGGPTKSLAHELVPDATTSDSSSETTSFRVHRPEFLDLLLSTLRAQDAQTRKHLRTFVSTEFQQMVATLEARVPTMRTRTDAICDGATVRLSLEARNGLFLAPADSASLGLVPIRSDVSLWVLEDGSREHQTSAGAKRAVSLRHAATRQYLAIAQQTVHLVAHKAPIELHCVDSGSPFGSGSRVRVTVGATYLTGQEFGLAIKTGVFAPNSPYTSQSLFILKVVDNCMHLAAE